MVFGVNYSNKVG